MWVTSKEYRKKYNITPQHLYAMKKSNNIKTKPYIGKSYLIWDSNFKQDNNKVFIYARISPEEDISILENQINTLKKYCISNGFKPTVIQDIDYSSNLKREGFNKLLNNVFNDEVSKIVISNKNRLSVDSYDIIEHILRIFSVEIDDVNLESNNMINK